MTFGIRIKSETGKTLYDSRERNYCFIGSQSVALNRVSNTALPTATITMPDPSTTMYFVRLESAWNNDFSTMCGLMTTVQGNQLRLYWTGLFSVSVRVYFMGIGTSGIKPKYGAVVYDENRRIVWSSSDTPLCVRRASVGSNAANPGTKLVSGKSCAVMPQAMAMALRNGGGSIFCNALGFTDGIAIGGYGNFNGYGNWWFNDSLFPHLTEVAYIETEFMD
ncbi:hypothetical protein FNI26_15240 [Salmonella enterica subsp. diarizonae]|nr:hypothetical protein [Salmonella enterica subsp. arizonae]ECJ5905504.1 hypothetical protein [Salmonella enterica subsp. diarizonae]